MPTKWMRFERAEQGGRRWYAPWSRRPDQVEVHWIEVDVAPSGSISYDPAPLHAKHHATHRDRF